VLVVLLLHLLRYGTVLRLPLWYARTSEFFLNAALKKFFASACSILASTAHFVPDVPRNEVAEQQINKHERRITYVL
jgi:hypothetical protein